MKYLSSAIPFLFIFLVSCDSKADKKESLAAPVQPITADPILPVKNDTAAAAFKADATLNPQHGQPGHRCDIAVGAPLNAPATNTQQNVSPTISPATTVAAPTTTTATAATTTTATATTNTNADVPKVSSKLNNSTTALNPKHGEPGHRCDIAVGAPLNSKPTQ